MKRALSFAVLVWLLPLRAGAEVQDHDSIDMLSRDLPVAVRDLVVPPNAKAICFDPAKQISNYPAQPDGSCHFEPYGSVRCQLTIKPDQVEARERNVSGTINLTKFFCYGGSCRTAITNSKLFSSMYCKTEYRHGWPSAEPYATVRELRDALKPALVFWSKEPIQEQALRDRQEGAKPPLDSFVDTHY
jgi:hypothetical protein